MNYQNIHSYGILFSAIALSTLTLIGCNSSKSSQRGYEAVQPVMAQPTTQQKEPVSDFPAPGND